MIMIIPIHGLKFHQFDYPQLGDEISLVKENENLFDPMAIAAFNRQHQQIGYVSAKNSRNVKIYNRMLTDSLTGKVWSISKNQILIEIDLPMN